MSEIKHMSVILLTMIIKNHPQTLAGRKLTSAVLVNLPSVQISRLLLDIPVYLSSE